MAIPVVGSNKGAAVAAKKRVPGKTPTHRLSVGHGDKENRTYTSLAFLFPTNFGQDSKALGGGELLPQTEENTGIQKNELVKYFVTKNRDGSTVLIKRVKENAGDEKGKFVTVTTFKSITKEGKEILVGEISPTEVYFCNPWAPK